MQITDVRIRKITAEGKMKAIVSVTFDNEFVVHEVRVREGKEGLVMSMPRKERNGKDIWTKTAPAVPIKTLPTAKQDS